MYVKEKEQRRKIKKTKNQEEVSITDKDSEERQREAITTTTNYIRKCGYHEEVIQLKKTKQITKAKRSTKSKTIQKSVPRGVLDSLLSVPLVAFGSFYNAAHFKSKNSLEHLRHSPAHRCHPVCNGVPWCLFNVGI